MPDRVPEPRECAVVEEGGLQRGVPERRAAKLVAIRRIPRDLLQAEIFVLARPIEDHITLADAKGRGDLRNADHVHPEVAEHLVGLPGHSLTLHAIALAKEDQRAAFLRLAQRCLLATRIAINRRIGEHEREFELGDGATEHDKVVCHSPALVKAIVRARLPRAGPQHQGDYGSTGCRPGWFWLK